VPLDGSPEGEAVLPFVRQLASTTEAEVLLLCAVTPIATWDAAASAINWEAEEASAGEYIETKRLEVAARDLTVRGLVVFGEAAQVVLRVAKDEATDLIAMTTHGRSGLARWVLGSVAEKVLHSVETPLLLVRPREERSSATPARIEKLLVPLDASELARSALPVAVELAQTLGASIVLFHTVTPPALVYPGFKAAWMDPRFVEEMVESARTSLTSIASEIKSRGIPTGFLVSTGSAVDSIIEAAEAGSADMVVMSTHGRSGVGRLVLGSIADAVVRRSCTPVMLVRPTQYEAS
jgi:nucleotide-binding universal stress UspA family protein